VNLRANGSSNLGSVELFKHLIHRLQVSHLIFREITLIRN
jgi:hypothetical protein